MTDTPTTPFVDVDTFVIAAVDKLAALAIPAEVRWLVACEMIALKHGWTIDEASTNLANLLEQLDADHE